MMKIKNMFEPFELSETTISGKFGADMDRFFYQRIYSDNAKNVIYKETEDAFRNKLDDASGVHGIWQGEFWGKWIISAAEVCRYSENSELKDFIKQAARNLIALQDEDGYIGTYRDQLFLKVTDTKKTKELLGWECDWNWNIWCRKYTLWGLIESYRLTDDKEILAATVKFANHLINQLHDRGINIAETGTFSGLPSCSILKPMLLLHEITNDKTYLYFALEITGNWEREDGTWPNLITNAKTAKPLDQWYGDPAKWAKAYELMSCLEGLIELYKVTGEEKYFSTVLAIHELLLKYEMNTVYSVGYNDIFHHASTKLNAITEPCDVLHWIRVNYDLYTLTGDIKYIDIIETAFYNPFLAAICKDGKWGARGVRSSGNHLYNHQQAKMNHSHCCVNNMPRGYMNVAQTFIMSKDEDCYINLYADFSLKTKSLEIEIKCHNFPSGNVSVTVNPNSAKNIYFRIPNWSNETTITYNDKIIKEKNSGYVKINIDKKTAFAIRFDVSPVIRKLNLEEGETSAWYAKRWSSNMLPEEYMIKESRSVITYGPLLLARTKKLGSTTDEIFSGDKICADEARCVLTPYTAEDIFAAYHAQLSSGTTSIKTAVCDFASAANEELEDCEYFSIFF